jgi:hypothetical protein
MNSYRVQAVVEMGLVVVVLIALASMLYGFFPRKPR